MKIFLVEDDDHYAEFLRRSLSGKGFTDIEIFGSGESCLEKIHKQQLPSIVIADYFLPGMNGFELHTILKKKYPSVQTVIMSANPDANLVLDLVKKGIRRYVIKNENVIDSLQAVITEDDDLFIDLH
jgi:CheY-like chemotaxis protein